MASRFCGERECVSRRIDVIGRGEVERAFRRLMHVCTPDGKRQSIYSLLGGGLGTLKTSRVVRSGGNSMRKKSDNGLVTIFPTGTRKLPSITLATRVSYIRYYQKVSPILRSNICRSHNRAVLKDSSGTNITTVLRKLTLVGRGFVPRKGIATVFAMRRRVKLINSGGVRRGCLRSVSFNCAFSTSKRTKRIFATKPSRCTVGFAFRKGTTRTNVRPRGKLGTVTVTTGTVTSYPSKQVSRRAAYGVKAVANKHTAGVVPRLYMMRTRTQDHSRKGLRGLINRVITTFRGTTKAFPSNALRVRGMGRCSTFHVRRATPLVGLFHVTYGRTKFTMGATPYKKKDSTGFFYIGKFPSILINIKVASFRAGHRDLERGSLCSTKRLMCHLLRTRDRFTKRSRTWLFKPKIPII